MSECFRSHPRGVICDACPKPKRPASAWDFGCPCLALAVVLSVYGVMAWHRLFPLQKHADRLKALESRVTELENQPRR